uniref:UDP-N-acetylglucosamine transferase subunit ALG13 n=1 Tax=Henneguya salminicola TaxID=69463 RepID=A0A6G3MIM1_HENSL
MIKSIFLTVGTTSFPELINAASSKKFCKMLKEMGIEEVTMQYGNGKTPNPHYYKSNDIKLNIFDFKNSITDDIQNCDIVICHAGSGSILEGLKHCKKLLVVINESLMNNHQIELAEKLASEEYLINCTIRNIQERFNEVFHNKLRQYHEVCDSKLGLYLTDYIKDISNSEHN